MGLVYGVCFNVFWLKFMIFIYFLMVTFARELIKVDLGLEGSKDRDQAFLRVLELKRVVSAQERNVEENPWTHG